MFSFLNPFLLWGLAAISAPILIHLLLRQKPRPRPWAAMRWLQNAMQAAQRKYKLTNLLLLLLRCLIVALLALAVSRPHWGLWSEGGDLVVLLDVSASMAADKQGNGPLADACQKLREQGFSQDRVCIISVGKRSQVLCDGNADEAMRTLQQIESDYLPGGLNRALEDEALALITANARAHSTVLCVSDFRQDDGSAIVKTLSDSVYQVSRWQVGQQRDNAYVHSINQLPDFVAGQAKQFQLVLNGRSKDIAHVQINGGSASPVTVQDPLQISLPPLNNGMHTVRVQFEDDGLAFDNTLDLRVHVRGAVPCLVVQQQFGYIAAAIDAAHQQLEYRNVDPARLHNEPLPKNGIVVLDATIGSPDRLVQWVQKGGVLWCWSDTLSEHPSLNDQLTQITINKDASVSGVINSDQNTMLRSLSRVAFNDLPSLKLGADAQNILAIGEESIAAWQALGDGYVIVCSHRLRANDSFWTQGAAPFWMRATLRDTSARASQPLIHYAGDIVANEMTLIFQDASEQTFAAGSKLDVRPGLATEKSSQRAVVVLPNQEESLLALPRHDGLARDLKAALPEQLGSDWSLWVLIALGLICLTESLFAGHAGRHYGHG